MEESTLFAFAFADDVDDARDEKVDARISSIEDFDASLTPRVSRTAAAGAMAIGLDAITRWLQQEA